jgi:hypothetical protein
MNRNYNEDGFPCAQKHVELGVSELTIRDYFAAKAMQAMIANDWPLHSGESKRHVTDSAYNMADAMLEARK